MYVQITVNFLKYTFIKVSQVTKIEIICDGYDLEKLMYQLTKSMFTKLLVFHILWSCLGCTISEGMV